MLSGGQLSKPTADRGIPATLLQLRQSRQARAVEVLELACKMQMYRWVLKLQVDVLLGQIKQSEERKRKGACGCYDTLVSLCLCKDVIVLLGHVPINYLLLWCRYLDTIRICGFGHYRTRPSRVQIRMLDMHGKKKECHVTVFIGGRMNMGKAEVEAAADRFPCPSRSRLLGAHRSDAVSTQISVRSSVTSLHDPSQPPTSPPL